MDQLAAEVSQLRNVNSAGVAQSEERLRALQAQYEDLMGCVLCLLGVLCWACCAVSCQLSAGCVRMCGCGALLRTAGCVACRHAR